MKKTDAQTYLDRIKRKPAKNESCLQSAIVAWCNGIGSSVVKDRFSSIPNGWGVSSASEKDRMIQGARLKREGVRKGMVDLIFWGCFGELPTLTKRGGLIPTMLWMEVKNGTSGRLSEEQKKVHASLVACGHEVVVVRDLAQAIGALVNFYGRGLKP